jgi:hypothetical protein
MNRWRSVEAEAAGPQDSSPAVTVCGTSSRAGDTLFKTTSVTSASEVRFGQYLCFDVERTLHHTLFDEDVDKRLVGFQVGLVEIFKAAQIRLGNE